MNAITITDYIRNLESKNTGDIYIYSISDVFIVYDNSALRLNVHFPEFPVVEAKCSDNRIHKVIFDFPIEVVLKKFRDCPQLVDDRCIHITNVS